MEVGVGLPKDAMDLSIKMTQYFSSRKSSLIPLPNLSYPQHVQAAPAAGLSSVSVWFLLGTQLLCWPWDLWEGSSASRKGISAQLLPGALMGTRGWHYAPAPLSRLPSYPQACLNMQLETSPAFLSFRKLCRKPGVWEAGLRLGGAGRMPSPHSPGNHVASAIAPSPCPLSDRDGNLAQLSTLYLGGGASRHSSPCSRRREALSLAPWISPLK